MSQPRLQWASRVALVAAGAVAFTAIGGAVATADGASDAPAPSPSYTFDVHTTGPTWTIDGGYYEVMNQTDAEHSYSGATNWDPFRSHEVVVKFHCTTGVNQALRDDLGPARS
jgi:hypothetical protein